MKFKQQYAAYQQAIEQYLEGLFSQDKPYGRLQEAMRYSILGGGKRIRPVLTLEFARLGGIDWHLALPYACALELVHNYSLIHDDLPCMDDDDLRRGQPTTHKKFGETLAVLAGDALQPEAFRLIAEAPCMSDGSRVEAVRVLARACGADGMVAGQVLDTLYGIQTEEQLKAMYRLKTGVMISGAAELGCVAADMPADMRAQAVEFADQLGLAFQIRDDMLDVIGDAQTLGKAVGVDECKNTFVRLYGMEACTALRQRQKLPVPAYGVLTDYTAIPFFHETRLNGYFVPHRDLIAELTATGMDASLLHPTGIPVSPRFAQHMPKEQAREHLSLPTGKRIYLVMTGGVAQNHGIVKALENQLGHEISTSPLTQYNGALGAALFAYQKALKKQP